MNSRNIHIMSEMPVTRAIIQMSIPSVLSMLVNILYNLTDTFFIGKLNDPVQVAAVSVSLPLFTLQMAIAGIFGIGGGSYVSRLLGKKDYALARETTTTAIFSSLVASLLLGVIGILSIPAFLKAVNASALTSVYARQYMLYILLGSPFVLMKFTMVQLIRAEGAAKQAMYGLFIGTGANIILDPLFIFVFKMGVTGAAIATVIGQGLGMLYYFYFYLKCHSIACPSLKFLHLRRVIYKETLLIGIPASLGQVMMSIGNMVSFNLASAYGDIAVAAMGVVSRVFSIPIFVFIGISIGMQPLVGYNYGAGNYGRMKRIIRTTVTISLYLGAAFTLLFALFPEQLVATFIKDKALVALGAQILEAYVFAIPSAAVGMIFMSSLQAMGKALPALIVSLSRQGLIYIPAIIILNRIFGFNGIIYAMPLADILTTMISGTMLFVILWKLKHHKPVIVEKPMPIAVEHLA